MTDESCATVYEYAGGEVSLKYIEENENIEVVFSDKTEVRRIMQQDNVTIICTYQLMHFMSEEKPFGFLKI